MGRCSSCNYLLFTKSFPFNFGHVLQSLKGKGDEFVPVISSNYHSYLFPHTSSMDPGLLFECQNIGDIPECVSESASCCDAALVVETHSHQMSVSQKLLPEN